MILIWIFKLKKLFIDIIYTIILQFNIFRKVKTQFSWVSFCCCRHEWHRASSCCTGIEGTCLAALGWRRVSLLALCPRNRRGWLWRLLLLSELGHSATADAGRLVLRYWGWSGLEWGRRWRKRGSWRCWPRSSLAPHRPGVSWAQHAGSELAEASTRRQSYPVSVRILSTVPPPLRQFVLPANQGRRRCYSCNQKPPHCSFHGAATKFRCPK